MMGIKGNFKFHGVGQGLFYTGDIYYGNSSFHFIYDCGSSSENSKNILSKSINNYLQGKEAIDMLVISHFHEDHINGLDKLAEIVKKKNIKIKRIFIPYFNPDQILLIILMAQMKEDWYYRFLLSPISYLSQTFGDNLEKIIVVITRNDIEGDDRDDRVIYLNENDQNLNDDNITTDIRSYGNPIGNVKVIKINGKARFEIKNSWMFKFFSYTGSAKKSKIQKDLKNCLDKIDEDLYDQIKKCIGKDTNDVNDDCLEAIEKIKKIKSCYEDLVKNKENLLKDVNNTSLVLYHSCLKQDRVIYRHSYSCLDKWNYYNCVEMNKIWDLEYINRVFGTFLTGDISLKNNKIFEALKKHYGDYIRKYNVLQVPHHGSANNWPYGHRKLAKCCKYFVMSYGLCNGDNHPNMNVVFDILESGGCPILVNEFQEFKYVIFEV